MNRFLIAGIFPTFCLNLGIASAAPFAMNGLEALPRSLPPRCEPLARIPASAMIATPTFAAHLSVANCMAEAAMNDLKLTIDDASIARLDAAVAPAVALLDRVIQVGDPYWKLVAEDAKRDLYLGMIVRERSIPGLDLVAHEALEAKLAPWQAQEEHAIVAMAKLGREHPGLAERDAVIAGVYQRIGEERVAGVAMRSR